jgi:hypothetical protein
VPKAAVISQRKRVKASFDPKIFLANVGEDCFLVMTRLPAPSQPPVETSERYGKIRLVESRKIAKEKRK